MIRWQARAASVLRVILVAVVALVVGVFAVGASWAFHGSVISVRDAELVDVAVDVVPTGYTVRGRPGVTGAGAPSFDRGHVRIIATSEQTVDLQTVREELVATGWDLAEQSERRADHVAASRDGIALSIALTSAAVSGDADPDRDGTQLEVIVRRGTTFPSLASTVVLGTVVAVTASITLTVLLTRGSSAPGRRGGPRGSARHRPQVRR